ncbi:YafY family transcriptional regulator [Kocuria soli]|uniref:YafY family transcriptional regulator n=1 Tax=Kocuria soli TaxID=2485125 RepID=A0A3N3ZRI8_9MICC|nr:YafY family protein [Kocuria soli]ROZ62163.1 YafY family transcriptional regulator [Kocuria soli]
MSDTTRRALRLLTLLQARPVWTGQSLADELGVTTRSLRRDIERLRDLGYPVLSEKGHGGGYQLGAGQRLPPLLLEADEAVAVGVGLRLAAASGITGLDEVAVRSLAHLEQLVHQSIKDQIATVGAAVDVVLTGVPPVQLETLLVLAQGVRGQVQLRLDYVARDGAATRRRVEPYRVLSMGRNWYLFAWDLDRDDWRTFRLDRIESARVTTFRYTARPTPDIQEHLRQAVSQGARTTRVRVRFLASREEVVAVIPAEVGTLEAEGPGSCVLTTFTEEFDWVAFRLVSLPMPVQVLEPPELVAAMSAMSERLTRTVERSR